MTPGMIVTQAATQEFFDYLLKKLRCPVCLSVLSYSFIDGRSDYLTCAVCKCPFLVSDSLPVLLTCDGNWPKKADEIEGEFNYNTKKIPMNVHLERTAYINKNSEMFLEESGADLSKDEILLVGSSQLELEFFVSKCTSAVSLDIGPSLTKECLGATQKRSIPAVWVCGDGECLPFGDEVFDAVIIRQSLHHMLKYYSAISEFFRVCKIGGRVLLIDEPFSQPDFYAPPLSLLSDNFHVYQGIELGHIREKSGIKTIQTKPFAVQKLCASMLNFLRRNNKRKLHLKKEVPYSERPFACRAKGFTELEKEEHYIKSDSMDPATYLADKYYSFSALQCIHAVSLHTDDFQLIWPREIAWTDESGDIVVFCRGTNSNHEKSLIDKLLSAGQMSIAARKRSRTTVLRDRSRLQAIPLELANILIKN